MEEEQYHECQTYLESLIICCVPHSCFQGTVRSKAAITDGMYSI